VGQDNVDTNPMYESSVVPRPQKELGHGKQWSGQHLAFLSVEEP
jgi:hypothetical protein